MSLSGSSGMPGIVVTSNMLSNANVQNVSQQQGAVTVTAIPQVLATQSVQPTEQTTTEAQVMLQEFWQKQTAMINNVELNDFKVQDLPLARIKKIMKMDDEVKMISAEAPLLFAKAAQMFITEISLRAWIHTEENKRRTLQRNDIATAITKFDQFDFLIDIVPREDLKPVRRPDEASRTSDPVQYFYTVPTSSSTQQPNQATILSSNVTPNITGSLQQGQIVLAQPGGQVVQINSNGQILNSDGQTVLQTSSEPQQTQGIESQHQNLDNTIVLENTSPTGTIVNQQSEGQQNIESSQNIIQRLISNGAINSNEIHSIQIGQDGNIQLIKVPKTTQQNNAVQQLIQTNQINTSDQQQEQRIIHISSEDNTMFEIPSLQGQQQQRTSNNNSTKNIVYTDSNS